MPYDIHLLCSAEVEFIELTVPRRCPLWSNIAADEPMAVSRNAPPKYPEPPLPPTVSGQCRQDVVEDGSSLPP